MNSPMTVAETLEANRARIEELERQLGEARSELYSTGRQALAREVDELRGVISETVNQRDAALALLREAQEVLADHWFTSVMDGDYGEDFNNEDVIAMDDKIKKFLPEAPK